MSTTDEAGPSLDPVDDLFDMGGDESSAQDDLDAKLERATSILDAADDDFGESETVARNMSEPADPHDMTMDKFIQTDSFDAPATVPPVSPSEVVPDEDQDDVSLDSFMNTSMFEHGVGLTNEDETVLPDQVPDKPADDDNPINRDTVVLPGSPVAARNEEAGTRDTDDDEDDDSEDPTILR